MKIGLFDTQPKFLNMKGLIKTNPLYLLVFEKEVL